MSDELLKINRNLVRELKKEMKSKNTVISIQENAIRRKDNELKEIAAILEKRTENERNVHRKLKEECEKLREEMEKAKEETAEIEDRYRRAAAFARYVSSALCESSNAIKILTRE